MKKLLIALLFALSTGVAMEAVAGCGCCKEKKCCKSTCKKCTCKKRKCDCGCPKKAEKKDCGCGCRSCVEPRAE